MSREILLRLGIGIIFSYIVRAYDNSLSVLYLLCWINLFLTVFNMSRNKSYQSNKIEVIPIIISICVMGIILRLSVAWCVVELLSRNDTGRVIMWVMFTIV
jgi:hypothetical protein